MTYRIRHNNSQATNVPEGYPSLSALGGIMRGPIDDLASVLKVLFFGAPPPPNLPKSLGTLIKFLCSTAFADVVLNWAREEVNQAFAGSYGYGGIETHRKPVLPPGIPRWSLP